MNRGLETLLLEPKLSVVQTIALTVVHVLGLLSLLLLPFLVLIKVSLALLMVLSLVYYWRRDLRRCGFWSITKARWSEGKGWSVTDAAGNHHPAVLTDSTFLSSYLVILVFKTKALTHRRLILTQDSLEKEQFRRLRVRLRLDPGVRG